MTAPLTRAEKADLLSSAMRLPALLVALAGLVAGLGPAAADDDDGLISAPMVIEIPTAWIQPKLSAHVSGNADHHLDSGARLAASMGRLVEIDLASDDLIQTCDPCGGMMRATTGLQLVATLVENIELLR